MRKYFFLLLFFYSFAYSLNFEEVKKVEKEKGILKALPLYEQLVNKGDKKAIFHLASIYIRGKKIKKDLYKARDILQKGKELKDKKSTYFLAKLYLDVNSAFQNKIKAFNIFIDLSNENYAPAQNMLGKFLLRGIVVKKDYSLAVKYFEKASKQNFIEAHCNLSFMYANGMGVFTNFGRAAIFAKAGMKYNHPLCKKVYKDFNLYKYKEDRGWKFNSYVKPPNE